jgi:hypothetical protein
MTLNQMKKQLDIYEQQIESARKIKDFDLVEQIYNDMIPLQDQYESEQRKLAFEKQLQEISDFYDDDKNRDAYTSRMVEMLCGEIIDRPLQVK